MSAVLKTEQLETIFDHGVTMAELIQLFGETEDVDNYLYALSQDSAYADLYFLYMARDDSKTALSFLNKIQNPRYKLSVSLPSCVQ